MELYIPAILGFDVIPASFSPETTSGGTMIVSPDANIVFASQSLSNVLGFSRKELEPKPLSDLVSEESQPLLQAELLHARNGFCERRAIHFRRKDGGYVSANIAISRSFKSWMVGVSFDGDLPNHRPAPSNDNIYEKLEMANTLVRLVHPETYHHQIRVSDLSVAIARGMQLGELDIEDLFIAARWHDVGKILTEPLGLLDKQGPLTIEEFTELQRHVNRGVRIIRSILPSSARTKTICRVVGQHHMHINGSGYPDNLTGEALLLLSKILTVADVADSMLYPRAYRMKPPGLERTLDALESGRGDLYDGDAVDICAGFLRSGRFQPTWSSDGGMLAVG